MPLAKSCAKARSASARLVAQDLRQDGACTVWTWWSAFHKLAVCISACSAFAGSVYNNGILGVYLGVYDH